MRKILSIGLPAFFILLCSFQLAAQSTDAQLLALLQKNYAQLHIAPADAKAATISSSFKDEQSGLEYAYVQQSYAGIPVFNQIISVALRNGQVVYSSGSFVDNIVLKAGATSPSIQPSAAIAKAAQFLQLGTPTGLQLVQDNFAVGKKYVYSPAGISKSNIETALTWVPVNNGAGVKLAWNVNIDVANSADWWNVRIDALTGEFISKDNWTVHESGTNEINHKKNYVTAPAKSPEHKTWSPPNVTTGAYRVVPFPNESPIHGALAIDNEPWLKAGANNNATTNGWHFDGISNYDITRGNNVHAYLDISNTNAPSTTNISATSTTGAPGLTFTPTPNFSLQPGNSTNQLFALTNLFYWNNLMHDVMYQYGFTEAAGNFQADNMGRGGNGADYVKAEGQDGGGTNNANFSTPADGGSGRMQMYLFTSSAVTVQVNTPPAIAGSYSAVEGSFSTANKLSATGPITAQVVYYNDDGGGTVHDACATAANPGALAGKIALINRNTCSFVIKVKNAQNAGAIGVIMVNNVPGAPIVMGGTDNTITIPAVMISDVDGALLAAQLANNVNATLKPPVNLDGDLDNGVVTHEYGHGISGRLTGGRLNSSCLSNAEQGGEGWSDYFALMMTTNWATAQVTDGTKPRPMGTYVVGQPTTGSGIRQYPYTTNMSVNPHTYADLLTSQEVHDIGEVWCSALWDMTWNIIQQENLISTNLYNSSSNGGNAIALRLVMEGLKLQPCQPGFLDARNAILAADSIVYNNRHKCAIWNAFARRGMGFSAQQGSSSSATDQVAASDLPSGLIFSKVSDPVRVNSGQQLTIQMNATCNCQPLSNFTVRDTIPAGFTYVSSTGGSVSGNVLSYNSQNFTASETKLYSVTLTASGTGCPIDTTVNDNRDNATTGGLSSVISSGSTNWASSTSRSRSGNAWYAADAATPADFSLVTNSFYVGYLSVFSFWHFTDLENGYDGGRLEISTDNGATWNDASPYIIQNNYNTSMADAPWGAGAKAFSGNTGGGFIQTVADLSSFVNKTVKLRLRLQTDNGNPATLEGWFLDDIRLYNGCGGVLKVGAYNGTNQLVATVSVPAFINGNGAPAVVPTVNPDGIVYSIAPNPAQGKAMLNFSKPVFAPQIMVYDLNGKLVQQTSLSSNVTTYTLPTDALANGTYIITIKARNFAVNIKLVIAH